MLEFTNKYLKNRLLLLFVSTTLFMGCDDDTPLTDITQFPRVSAISSSTLEDTEQLNATVELSWAFEYEVTLDYAIKQKEEPSAEEGIDFVAQAGTLTFAPGETSQSISVEIFADAIAEPDEQFLLSISNPVYGKIIQSEAILTIINDDEGFFVENVGPDSPLEYPGYALVWQDEFDGDAINTDNWTYDIGGDGWGNNELQYYTDGPANSFVSSGYLVIEARQQAVGSNDYSSARLITADKQSFQYGRVDIRARLPKGRGLWPALWMLGDNFFTEGWPQCGEIDIMELVGHQPSIAYGTAHYGANLAEHQFKGGNSFLSGEQYGDKFHVFSIIWKENSIQWLRDGIPFFTLTPSDLEGAAWPFNKEFFFIFNVAVGGNWPGDPDEDTVFPQRMIVDYIRVFQ